jgi:hypothetical protein
VRFHFFVFVILFGVINKNTMYAYHAVPWSPSTKESRYRYTTFTGTGPDTHDLREEEAEKWGSEGGLPSENL